MRHFFRKSSCDSYLHCLSFNLSKRNAKFSRSRSTYAWFVMIVSVESFLRPDKFLLSFTSILGVVVCVVLSSGTCNKSRSVFSLMLVSLLSLLLSSWFVVIGSLLLNLSSSVRVLVPVSGSEFTRERFFGLKKDFFVVLVLASPIVVIYKLCVEGERIR